MKILGIETSCDETAAAVLEIKQGGFKILSNVVASSVELQAKYGGIVPEVAARKQMEYILPVVGHALQLANSKLKTQNSKFIDYIAVTNGPGLVTSLRVGVEVAKTLSYVWGKPLVAVNHMEGHIYSALLKAKQNKTQNSKVKTQKLENIKFPALALLVSGGHTQLVLVKDYLKYKIIGETLDDAVGEAFDKVAKILNLGYPGGPIISKLAAKGSATIFDLPRPMINSGDYNFSFSGIKTSVLYKIKNQKSKIKNSDKKDLCASFEQACVDVLVQKTIQAARDHQAKTIILGGGVAANKKLREQLKTEANKKLKAVHLLIPEIELTGDNALMIALAGYYKIRAGRLGDWRKVKVDPNLKL